MLESDADAAEFVTFEEITVTKKNGKRETKRVKLALYPDLPARGRAFGDSDTNYIPIDGSNSGRSPTSALLQRTNMPIIEIASFAVSEAFLADPSIVTPALDFLIGVDGCLGYVKLNLTQRMGLMADYQCLSWDPRRRHKKDLPLHR